MRFPIVLLTVTTALTSAVLVWHGITCAREYHTAKMRNERDFRIHELQLAIQYLDEVLTNSALLAAATGDSGWEARYRRAAPRLEASLEELAKLTADLPPGSAAVSKTAAANLELVRIEHRAFGLVRAGRMEAARELLFGPEYQEQKARYAEGLVRLAADLKSDTQARLEREQERALWQLCGVAAVLPVLGFGWFACARAVLRHWNERKRQHLALKAAHAGLQTRVAEHSADLNETRKQLETEISERRRTEVALTNTEMRLQAVLDYTTAVIYAKDLDGRYILTNRRHEELFHRSRLEVLGKTDFEIFPDDVARSFCENDRRVLAENAPIQFEETAPHDDGEHTYISLKFPLRDAEGRAYALCGISTDITDRKRAEEELRQSKNELAALAQEHRTLLDHTKDFLYRHDADGMFTYVSPSVEQVTGYTVEEWFKHYTAYLTDNPVNQAVVRNTEETLRTGQERGPYLVEIHHKDGHPIMLEVNERPYAQDGKVAGIIGVARDVTERVRAEEALKKAKETAESASRAKSVFLANLSHEVRTPIMAILAAAELARPVAESTGNGLDRRDVVLRNGRHLLALVDGLLDVARLEAGKLSVQLAECSLPEILADIRAIVLPLHNRDRVAFKMAYETALPERIRTDATRLKQAVVNLIDNAFKAVEDGEVRVRVRADAAAQRLTVAVEDTGPGVPPEARARIFETFAQLGPRPGEVAKGVGLGLPLARAIAEKLDGTVQLDTEMGEGTRFTLHVGTGPLDSVRWLDPEELDAEAAGAGSGVACDRPRLQGHVLVAEDLPDTKELLATALSEAGAEVTAVETGRQAVEAAMAHAFDLIILDIRMPDMDGYAAAAELRRRSCRCAIIALTASVAHPERDRILKAGFDDVWFKPIAINRFLAEAAAYLETAADVPRPEGASAQEKERGSGHDSRFRRIVLEFAGSLPARVADVRASIERGDVRRAREILHQLAGAGGIHGYMDLSHEAGRVLKLAKNGRLAGRPQELGPLEAMAEAIGRQAADTASGPTA